MQPLASWIGVPALTESVPSFVRRPRSRWVGRTGRVSGADDDPCRPALRPARLTALPGTATAVLERMRVVTARIGDPGRAAIHFTRRSLMTAPISSGEAAGHVDPAGSGQVVPRRPDRSSRAERPLTTGRVALGVRSRSDALAGQLLKQRPNLGLEEPSMSARRPDAVDPAGGSPPRDRLRVDTEQCSHLTRREQSLPWVHSLPLVLDSHAVQGQGSARADTQ
jgi:hypothetical protein